MKREQIIVENGPKAIGPYSSAVKVGPMVFVSGQLPVKPDGTLVADDIGVQTRQVIENLELTLEASGLGLENVVKTTVFLSDFDDFDKMNQMYALYFMHPYPARVCVEVGKLPKGSRVEIDAIALEYESDDREEHDDCGGSGCDE